MPKFSRRPLHRLASMLLIPILMLSGCSSAAPAVGSTEATTASATLSQTPAPTPDPTQSPTPDPTPAPTPKPEEISVTVDSSKQYQTFLGFGGNYTQIQYAGKALDSIGKYTLETLRPEWVRVPIPLDLWEPVNDNKKAGTIDWAGFATTDPKMVDLFTMMKAMKETYGVKNITASVWNIAAWMVDGEPGTKGGVLPEEKYGEVAESMIAFLLHLRDEYGVAVDQISFNEPDIGTNVKMNSTDMIKFVRVLGPMLDKAGLTTKWLIGDVSQPNPAALYMSEMLSVEDIAPYLGPVSLHTWNSSAISDMMLANLRDAMPPTGKILIAGEFGFNPGLWRTPEEFPKWQTGWFLANLIYRTVKYTGTNVILYWELENDYPLMSETLEKYPSWHVFKQAFDTLKPGSVLLDCQSENESFLGSYAAADGKGYFTLQLLNKREKPLLVTVSGLPDGTLSAFVTSETSNQEDFGQHVVTGGTMTLEIPAKSFVSFQTP